MLMSTEMVSSILYANENGVSLVGTRSVVLYAHNTSRNFFFANLSLSLSKFLHRLSKMVWLLILAWTLPRE